MLALFLWTDLLSQVPLTLELTPKLFSANEIADSGFRKILVLKDYYDEAADSILTDTAYEIRFSKEGFVLYEKKTPYFNDSTISVYTYDKGLRLTGHETNRYVMQKKVSQSVQYFYKDNRQSELHFYFRGRLGSKQRSFYDKKGRLSKTESLSPDSFRHSSFYYYNNNDSLNRVTSIETYDSRSDSIVTTYKYDEAGRIIEKRRSPSATYIKNMGADCYQGLTEYYRCEYDSLGRVIFETSTSDEELDKISYAWYLYKRYFYIGNGFTCKDYDSENRENALSTYTRFAGKSHDGNSLIETYNDQIKETKYLSDRSLLPFSIIYSGDSINKSVSYLFLYKK